MSVSPWVRHLAIGALQSALAIAGIVWALCWFAGRPYPRLAAIALLLLASACCLVLALDDPPVDPERELR